MTETRTRPARESQRFLQIVRANLWFFSRMRDAEDRSWDVLQEWIALTGSVQIRRHNAAVPDQFYENEDQTVDDPTDADDDLTTNPDQDAVDAGFATGVQ